MTGNGFPHSFPAKRLKGQSSGASSESKLGWVLGWVLGYAGDDRVYLYTFILPLKARWAGR